MAMMIVIAAITVRTSSACILSASLAMLQGVGGNGGTAGDGGNGSARSDSGGPWQTAIATEFSRLAADDRDADDSAVVLPIHDESAGARSRTAAA
jgi:hypothetical protein